MFEEIFNKKGLNRSIQFRHRVAKGHLFELRDSNVSG